MQVMAGCEGGQEVRERAFQGYGMGWKDREK